MIRAHSARKLRFEPDLPLVLLIALFALLWVAGGASRADVMGQVIVRAGCWAIFIIAILFGPKPDLRASKPVLFLLLAIVALPAIQLIPLPPSWWLALPGREILLIPGEPVPWRPWTMTPGATRNALASLIVPSTTLLLLAQANERTHRWIPMAFLVVIGLAVVLGLLQFSGAGFNNPFLNDTPGQASSIFANRNHFALLLAIGCLIAPVWALSDSGSVKWRGPLCCGLILLFVLTILATGSRGGMLLCGVALALSLLFAKQKLRRYLKGAPRWVAPTLVVAVVSVIGGFILLSVVADRAQSIARLMSMEAGDDMRVRALPTVLSMVATYMPFGSGFGGFDPVFRIHEPFDLLKLTYFNQAHNDYLGVALDGGVAGLAVLGAGILWWLAATIRVWIAKTDDRIIVGRLGSSVILLILLASATDYPARTPIIMMALVTAAIWLARATGNGSNAALPNGTPNL